MWSDWSCLCSPWRGCSRWLSRPQLRQHEPLRPQPSAFQKPRSARRRITERTRRDQEREAGGRCRLGRAPAIAALPPGGEGCADSSSSNAVAELISVLI